MYYENESSVGLILHLYDGTTIIYLKGNLRFYISILEDSEKWLFNVYNNIFSVILLWTALFYGSKEELSFSTLMLKWPTLPVDGSSAKYWMGEMYVRKFI